MSVGSCTSHMSGWNPCNNHEARSTQISTADPSHRTGSDARWLAHWVTLHLVRSHCGLVVGTICYVHHICHDPITSWSIMSTMASSFPCHNHNVSVWWPYHVPITCIPPSHLLKSVLLVHIKLILPHYVHILLRLHHISWLIYIKRVPWAHANQR